MNKYNSIIDLNKLNLIKGCCKPREIKKIDKTLNKLFTRLNSNSQKLLNLLNRFNMPAGTSAEPYNIGNRKVLFIKRNEQVKPMINDIYDNKVIGFDTEQRPTFKKGESQKKISIIQIATKKYCYIIQTILLRDLTLIKNILSDPGITKVGFGLGNDTKELQKQFNVKPESLFDLSPFIKTTFLAGSSIGAKKAVFAFMDKKLQKSKNAALSNWENQKLSPSQIKYASEDATAPLDVYYEIVNEFSFLDEVNNLK